MIAALTTMAYETGMDTRVADAILFWMKAKDIRFKDLVNRTGLTKSTVNRHLKAKIVPNYEARKRYADALEVSVAEFESQWQSGTSPDLVRLAVPRRLAELLTAQARAAELSEMEFLSAVLTFPDIARLIRSAVSIMRSIPPPLRITGTDAGPPGNAAADAANGISEEEEVAHLRKLQEKSRQPNKGKPANPHGLIRPAGGAGNAGGAKGGKRRRNRR